MKTALIAAGAVLLTACAAAFLLALLSRGAYYHLLDGSPEQFVRLKRRMKAAFISAFALAAAGAACFIVRAFI